MTRYFSVHEALDIAEAVLFAELMTFAALFTITHLDGIPRSMPLIHGLLLAGGLLRGERCSCASRPAKTMNRRTIKVAGSASSSSGQIVLPHP